jgi:hypothetical protein
VFTTFSAGFCIMGNPIAACKAFWQVLTGTALVPQAEVEQLQRQLEEARRAAPAKAAPAKPAAPPPPAEDRFAEGAVYTLLLLQREGRLVDFLQENLDSYADEQIGAAVRQIHKDSAKVLREVFGVTPVLSASEGEPVTAPEPLDPASITLTGNVPERPPYRGTLRHKGWRAGQLRLPARTGKLNSTLIQPAEVEL